MTTSTPIAKGNANSPTQPAQRGPSSPPFRIATRVRHSGYYNALFYGEPGVGKTVLCGSASDVIEMRDVIFVDVENGALSISDKEGIDVISINSWSQIARVKEFLRLHCELRDRGANEDLLRLQRQYIDDEATTIRKYRTVVVDSLTEAQKLAMYFIYGVKIGNQRLDVEPDAPEYKQWYQVQEMVRSLLRELRDLPMHVLATAHEQSKEDDRKKLYRLPNLSGKMAKEIQGVVDVVGWMQAGNVVVGEQQRFVRRLWLQPRPQFNAKNRFPGFKESFIDNAKMSDLIRTMRNPEPSTQAETETSGEELAQ